MTTDRAEIVQFKKSEEAKFICSACGADRGCNCNAPAVEKLATKLEQDRQRAKAYRERKNEGKQEPRHVTEHTDDQACHSDVTKAIGGKRKRVETDTAPPATNAASDHLNDADRSRALMWLSITDASTIAQTIIDISTTKAEAVAKHLVNLAAPKRKSDKPKFKKLSMAKTVDESGNTVFAEQPRKRSQVH
jgi:hypothetical protein